MKHDTPGYDNEIQIVRQKHFNDFSHRQRFTTCHFIDSNGKV